MDTPLTTETRKASLREDLRARRRSLALKNPTPDLIHVFKDLPVDAAKAPIIAGFAPIGDEIDIWPLMKALWKDGRRITLPVIIGSEKPLGFREWTPDCKMEKDRYGISYPIDGEPLTPNLIFVPLLGFTLHGDRLGYGGGYYDRTLAALRREGEVFACGVAYAGQEVAKLPTDAHDAKLDGILTDTGFKAFA